MMVENFNLIDLHKITEPGITKLILLTNIKQVPAV